MPSSKTAKLTLGVRTYPISYLWSGGVEVTGKGTKGGWSFTCVYWCGDNSVSCILTLYTLFYICYTSIKYF